MSVKRCIQFASSASLIVLSWFTFSAPMLAASEESKPLSMEEIRTKRRIVREQLMLPSLHGVRGIAYGVVGSKNYETLEKDMAAKLGELGIPLFRFSQLKEGVKPVDALVEIDVFRIGDHTMAELRVRQWVSLLRSPKTQARAVTYANREVVQGTRSDAAVSELAQQFVIDFLKANNRSVQTSTTSAEAEGGTKHPKRSH